MRRARWAAAFSALALLACTNDPYPQSDADRKILYTSFVEAPKTLDPAVAYTTSAHAITGNVYGTLLEYHYLERPYTLMPGLAEAMPEAEPRADGKVAYRFRLRPGMLYQDDPCFAPGGEGRRTREIVAQDVAFELMRLADPDVNSPVADPFSNIDGFRAFGERLTELRRQPALAALRPEQLYARAGGIAGAIVRGSYELEIVLAEPYPQILYWFAMPFSSPVPWEAVAYYDGREGRPRFADHPVASGPYVLATYDKQFRMVLEANANWYGARHPEWKAPGATYPTEGEAGDAEAGLLDPAVIGRPLPFITRVEFRREKEPIPTFNKFLQGYYDSASIVKESFDQVVRDDRLSPEMAALGIHLTKEVDPTIYYLGFNMEDAVVGDPAGDRSRKLRQAMSLVIDADRWTALFANGRGVAAQSLIPPGIFGYESDYLNPYRTVDVERARSLLREAGYPGGIDPATQRPLRLTFDTYQTSSQQMLQNQFFVDAWREIGLDVRIEATNYNQFQEKVRNGAYQIFAWGWVADYPDPENFMFLLTCAMARSRGGGPNTANFCNSRFDALFEQMRVRPNDAERLALIRQMRTILERERPWIELIHMEAYSLYHGWLRYVKPFGMSFQIIKYEDIDVDRRARLREAWNVPVLWPAYALLGVGALLLVPGVVTFYRERQ
jgi:oligopeptide transport system substrate-binding protein